MPLLTRRRLAGALYALPFLVAILLQGMPLGRELEEVVPQYAEQIHESTASRVTVVGNSSMWPTLIWVMLYLVAVLVLQRQRALPKVFTLFRIYPPVGLLFLLVASGALWSPSVEKIFANLTHGVGVLLLTAVGVSSYRDNLPRLFKAVANILVVNLLVQLASVVIAPSLAIDLDGRWAGLTGHPNILGSIALFCAWAICSANLLGQVKLRGRLLSVGGLAVCFVALWGSNSVTSSLCAVLVLGCSIAGKAFGSETIRVSRIILLLAAISCVVVPLTVVLGVDIWQIGPAMAGRSSDMSGRTYLWLAAVELIQQNPVFGWGFDDNARVILSTGMPHTTYHNGYLDIAVRGGVVGLGLVFVLLVASYIRSSQLPNDALKIVSVSLLYVSMVYNISEVTYMVPRNLGWMCLMLLLHVHVSLRPQRVMRSRQLDSVVGAVR